MRQSGADEVEADGLASPLGEQERNRLLRRADWRFLLGDVHPKKTICFTGGPIAQATRFVSQEFAEASIGSGGPYDLAVAVDPDDATLRQAWDSLAPGGWLYAEWRARRKRNPSSIRQWLTSAGFSDVTLYWPRPDPDAAPSEIWLPLESPEVLGYYLDNRPPARNLARRLARAVRRLAFLPRPRFNLPNPVSSVARRPATDSPGSGSDESEATSSSAMVHGIQEHWTEWNLGPAPPARLHTLLVTRGLRASGKAVGLVFAEGAKEPAVAVKMPRLSESAAVLRREATILGALRGHDRIRGGVPRLLSAEESSSSYRLVETAVDGLPAFVAVTEQNFPEIAQIAADWLAQLAGRPEVRPKSEWWNRLLEPLLSELEERFARVVRRDFVGKCRRILGSLGPLPLVWEQRDFSPWNVLVNAGKITALDWESAEPEGLPLLDLVYFLTYLSFSIDRAKKTGRFIESYRSFLDPTSFTGRISKRCFDGYSAAIGLDTLSYRPLRMAAWLVHLRSEYSQLLADAAHRPSKETLKGALFLRLLEEEIRDEERYKPCSPLGAPTK